WRGRVGDQIAKGGGDALVASGLGVRDVAGDVLQRKGLRLQTTDRRIQCVENTHDIVSNSIRAASRRSAKTTAAVGNDVASSMPIEIIELFQLLKQKAPVR